jgi:Phosphotransferase enzyme family
VLTRDGNFCGVIDFGDLCAGDPAYDLAAGWILLPDGMIDRFNQAYAPDLDPATRRRARGLAVSKALVCLLIGDAGDHGRPGGKPSWGPPARESLRRLGCVTLVRNDHRRPILRKAVSQRGPAWPVLPEGSSATA